MCKITVLLPVKNGEQHISQAVDSVLHQSFEDFELLIFDDHSTDHTMDILQQYKDSRITVYADEFGLVENLNMGIAMANGTYIARMDADDIMHPVRLEKQLTLMENSNITVCSSRRIIFGDGIDPYIKKSVTGLIDHPLVLLSYYNFLVHPATMIRRQFLNRYTLKYEHYLHAEDYKLWFEIAKRNGRFYVEPTPLLFYRVSPNQVSSSYQQEMEDQSLAMRQEIVRYLEGLA